MISIVWHYFVTVQITSSHNHTNSTLQENSSYPSPMLCNGASLSRGWAFCFASSFERRPQAQKSSMVGQPLRQNGTSPSSLARIAHRLHFLKSERCTRCSKCSKCELRARILQSPEIEKCWRWAIQNLCEHSELSRHDHQHFKKSTFWLKHSKIWQIKFIISFSSFLPW